jgi:hypothetical protein
MICAVSFRPSLLWRRIAFTSIFLSSAAVFADETLWKMYVETGTQAYEHRRYATAETIFLAARTEAEGFGLNDVRLATTLFQLARVYSAENEYEKAEQHYRRAIEIWDTISAPASIDFANALNELGNLYYQNNRGPDAQQCYTQALKIREERKGPAHPDLIIPLTNLAGNLRNQKKYDVAEPVYKRAQDIAEKYLDPDDLKVADVLSKEADNFYDEAKYGEAEPLYRRALEIKAKNQRSENDPVVISSIERLAVTLFEQEKFSQSRPLVEQAIAILEKNNQPRDLALPLTFLGNICEKLRKYEEAENAYKRALDAVGIDNSAALRTLENYSRMLRDLKREPEAQAYEAHIAKIRDGQKH